MGEIIGDFGVKGGTRTFRVCGTIFQLDQLLSECAEMKIEFLEEPKIEHVYRGQYTMLLQIKVKKDDNSKVRK